MDDFTYWRMLRSLGTEACLKQTSGSDIQPSSILFFSVKGTKPGVGLALFHALKIPYYKRHTTKSYNYSKFKIQHEITE